MPELVDWLIEHVPEFNDKRLPSLYSDLAQQKSANPDGFAANVVSWEQAFTRAALAGQLPADQKIILNISGDLLSALRTSRYGQPTRLGLVFDEAIKRGIMMRLATFQSAEESIYHKRWIPSLGTVGSWLLHQTGLWSTSSFDKNGKLVPGRLVLVEVLENLARQVDTIHTAESHGLTDNIMSKEAFQTMLQNIGIGSLSPQELECLLLFMQRDKQMLTFNSNTVKFKANSTSDLEAVTEEDASIASIKSLMNTLSAQISALTVKVDALQEKAQNHVRAKNRTAALAALKSKKLAEKNLEQRTATHQQLEEVFLRIEQAADQVQIMQVMQSSATTLKSLNQRVGGVDRVDAIMEDLREQIIQTDEVGQVISEPISDTAILDDTEIDEEFETLQREETAKREELEAEATRQKLGELPGPAAQSSVELANADLDAELAKSAEKLKGISLADKDTENNRESASENVNSQPLAA